MNTDIEVTAETKPAGFWIRVLASLIDTVLILVVTMPILLAIYGADYFTAQGMVQGPADFLISYVFPAVAVIAFWLLARGTPGKLLCGLRVVDAGSGETIELWQAIVRYLGYFVSMIPLCLGFVWVGLDGRKQGFHDKLARTMVVWKNR
jgi:uncharacterized RDD family membrane protein YckC